MNPHPNSAAHRLQLNRRRFLRGLGACIALPAFESWQPWQLLAANPHTLATTASGAPLRTAFLFFPNGAIPDAWWPKGDEKSFELSRTLQPLEAIRSQIQVFGGLDQKAAYGGPDGAGDHARGNGVF